MSRARFRLEPPGLREILRTMLRVMWLRCPNCGRGRLSNGPFRMRARCDVCGVTFERSTGEFTGAMGLNSIITCAGIAVLSLWVGIARVPYGLWLVVLFAVVFPIAFYRHSRALWIGIIHLAGLVHHDEAAEPEPVIRPWPGAGEEEAPPADPSPKPSRPVSRTGEGGSGETRARRGGS